MTHPIIEVVAQKIYEHLEESSFFRPEDRSSWGKAAASEKDHMRTRAKELVMAALTVMREPSRGMKEAGYATSHVGPVTCHRAMIDALREEIERG